VKIFKLSFFEETRASLEMVLNQKVTAAPTKTPARRQRVLVMTEIRRVMVIVDQEGRWPSFAPNPLRGGATEGWERGGRRGLTTVSGSRRTGGGVPGGGGI